MATDTTTRIYELQVKLAQESLANLKKLQQHTKDAEARFASLQNEVKKFGASLVAAFSVGAIVAAVHQAIQAVDELGAAAQRVGVGVEQFSALAYAAEQADASMADLEMGLKELQKSMVETGTKGAKVLDALGIDKTKPQVEVLKDFADGLKTIQTPALQTNAILEVLGKTGLRMRGLMDQGGEGITKMMERAQEMGFVVGGEVATKLSDLDNVIKDSKKSYEALTRTMTVGLTPALSDVMKGFQNAAKDSESFKAFGEGLGIVLRGVASAASFVTHYFKQLGTLMGALGAGAQAIAERNWSGFATVLMEANRDLETHRQEQEKTQKIILGLAPAVDTATAATAANTGAVKSNDAAVRAALTTADDYVSHFEKLAKVMQEQITRLQSVASENVELEKAVRAVGEAMIFLSPIHQMHAMRWLATVAAIEQANKLTKEHKAALTELEGILKSVETDYEKVNNAVFRLEELMVKFPERSADIREAINRLYAEYFEKQRKANDTVTESNKLLEALADKIDGYAKSIADTFVNFATGAQEAKFSFTDFATSVLRDLMKMVTQLMIIEPMMASLKQSMKSSSTTSSTSGAANLLGSWFGAAPQARGAVYASPSLSRYSGGVYDSPQAFAFASGAGVFAEAGPEAIMPLKRGPDGSLGVQASGAGGDVTVNVINEAGADVDVQTGRTGNGEREISVFIQRAVTDGFARGRFDSVMGATYGITRRGK